MYQFNSQIDQLLTNIGKRTPNGGLFRGGGLPKGGGLTNFRGGGLPKTRSGIPDGGYKQRPKAIRTQMEREEETVVQEEGAESGDDEDMASASASASGSEDELVDTRTSVLAGKNAALGGAQAESKQDGADASAQHALSPKTNQRVTQLLSDANIDQTPGKRSEKYYFVRHPEDKSGAWLYAGRGKVTFMEAMSTKSDTHLRIPYNGKRVEKSIRRGPFKGYQVMMISGRAGKFIAESNFSRTLDQFRGGRVLQNTTPPTAPPVLNAASGGLTRRQLAMGAPLPLNATS